MNPNQVLSYVKSRDFIVCLHFLFSASSIAGISVWAASNDIYTLTGSYNFYWVLSIFTFLLSLFSILYYKFPQTWKYLTSQSEVGLSEHQSLYSMFGFSFLLSILWLVASASVADTLRVCHHFKKHWQSDLLDYNYKCNGEIVSTTFGFMLFGTWSTACYLLSKKMYSKLNEPTVIDVANPRYSLQTI